MDLGDLLEEQSFKAGIDDTLMCPVLRNYLQDYSDLLHLEHYRLLKLTRPWRQQGDLAAHHPDHHSNQYLALV